MICKTTGGLSVLFFSFVLLVAAGCETPKCVARDVRNMPETICEGARGAKSVVMSMDEWFRENLW